MASVNPFDLLVDDDNDDLSQLIAKKASLAPTSAPPPQQQQPKPQAKLPSKPLPPAQAVKEQRNEGRGGGRGGGGREGGGRYGGGGGGDREGGRGFGGGGRGRGDRDGGGGRGYNRDRVSNENSFSTNGAPPEEGDVDKSGGRRGGGGGGGGGGFSPRGGYRGGRRGGYNNGEVDGERPRRVYERHSATGRGNEVKREGAGRGNWGSVTDEMAQDTEELVNAETAEKSLTPEKLPGEEVTADAGKENPVAETEEKEPEEKEMTLEEYEKVMEEKRKALLQGLKVEERKVTVDKEFETMQQLSGKKSNNDVYAKLGSDKDKKKEIADKDERAKKSVSINEFLKPAEGERFYSPGGRGGRGRGRGARGGGGGGFSGGQPAVSAPSIEDPGQFPQLK